MTAFSCQSSINDGINLSDPRWQIYENYAGINLKFCVSNQMNEHKKIITKTTNLINPPATTSEIVCKEVYVKAHYYLKTENKPHQTINKQVW